jgi:hypothetical protein
MYGDFGRYVMQSAVQNFTDPAAVNSDAERLSERYPQADAGIAKWFILQRVVEPGWPDEKGEFDRFERSTQTEDLREALFHGGCGCLVSFDGNTERIDQEQVRTRRPPFPDAPRYSMRHREGAMVRLDIGQGAS